MIKVGSRDSRLAVVQAEEVMRRLGECELEENDALREQLSVTQSDAKNAAAAASELQKQVDEIRM